MTKPVRRFCSTQARFGMAIQTGRPLTAKRMSVASAWRVAMATTVPFQVQWRGSAVQRSATVKSSYMALSRVVQGWCESKVAGCLLGLVFLFVVFWFFLVEEFDGGV